MPDAFPPDIRDLIQNMLCVDVTKRINIEGIKSHEAFRRSLPGGYVIPTPIPVVTFRTPIALDAIDDRTIQLLLHIGYEAEEIIKHELTSDRHAMAKVFYAMMNGTVGPDLLPWPGSATNGVKAVVPSEAFDMSPKLTPMADINTVDPFHRRPRVTHEQSAPESSFSLAKPATWAPVFAPETVEIREVFEGIPGPVELLMTLVQEALAEMNYQQFHPNQLRIVARRPNANQYLSLDVEFRSPESVNLLANVSGDVRKDELSQIWGILANIAADRKAAVDDGYY
jgi:hypothetical protein